MAKSQKTIETSVPKVTRPEPRGKSPWDIYATDKQSEADGVWLPFDGFEVCLKPASDSNPKFTAAYLNLRKRYGRRIDNNKLASAEVTKLLAELYADHIVVGWKDVIDPDDPDRRRMWPFTRENVVRMLVELLVVFNDIREFATDYQTFCVEETEEAAKN